MNQIDLQVQEINNEFKNRTKALGYDNTKGTLRHKYEVDFAYALNDIRWAPIYIAQKFVDRLESIVVNLSKEK